MTRANVRLPEDWRRFDRAGVLGTTLLSLLLALLALTGFGPTAYRNCEVAAARPMLSLASDGGKVTLTGSVADVADRTLLLDAARSRFGAGNVVDKLTVDRAMAPLGWSRNAGRLVELLKSFDAPAAIRTDGAEVVIEGSVADNATRGNAARDVVSLLGGNLKLKDVLAVRPAPPPPPAPVPVAQPAPVVAPPPRPVIAAGQLGRHKLPDGTEIAIVGGGLESKVVAFLEDPARQVDRALWFDFDRLHFTTGSASLTAESRAQVETVAAIMKAYPNAALKIGGYTDNVGDADANLRLSGVRAKSVADELIGLGVAADRIESEGYGEQHPIADNATPEGRAANRRTALSVRRK